LLQVLELDYMVLQMTDALTVAAMRNELR